jgi:hypothetical protein
MLRPSRARHEISEERQQAPAGFGPQSRGNNLRLINTQSCDLALSSSKETPLRCRNRFRPSARIVLALLAIGSIWGAAQPACANDQLPANSEAEKGAATDRPGPPIGPPAAIEGFRQARFGMSEEQVRGAIRGDFPVAAASLTGAVNPSEKTTILSLIVPDLLPHTGKAHISYIFGYHSKKLIQVNILWSSDRNPAADETIVGAANSLRDYFASEAFRPDSVVVNHQLAANSILVFRGSDDQKRTVLMVLSGAAAARSETKTASRPSPLTLELSYIEDAAHPDVFRIGKGQF